MTISHNTDLIAIPEMKELVDFVARRMSMTAEEAAASQPEFERELRERTLGVERRVHAMDFGRMDVDVPGIVAGGVRYRRRTEKSVGRYTTLAGVIEVERTSYRARGGHGGQTVAALDFRLGLVADHWTPVAAQVASTFMASLPSKEAASLLLAAGTMSPSSSHLDRVAKHVGGLWEAGRVEFEVAVRDAERLDLPSPEHVAVIAISLDGIMVPMKDAERTPGLGKKDQGPKGYKEAGCGTLALYDAAGKRLNTIRFGRMPERHKRVLHQQLASELEPLIERYASAKVVAVADGAKENWRILREIADDLGCEIIERLDFFHAAQHLIEGFKAAGLSDEQVAMWRTRLKNEVDVAEPLIEELGFLAAVHGKKAIATNFEYFINNAARLDYAEATAAQQPIGSGVQEAACKTVVGERLKRSGMTWRTRGGQAILTLRGLAQSGRLHHAWGALVPTLPTAFEVDPDLRRKRPTKQAA
jgi:hypothetical protein